MELRGVKVKLRAIRRDDLPLLMDMLNDPEIERMVVGYAAPVSMEMQERWYESLFGKTDPMRWIIETEKDGAVGTVVLGDFDWKNRVAHLTGVKVDSKRITDSGVALDAMMTMLKYGFEELNLNRIEGSCIDYNKQAMALNKLIGYVIEGTKRESIFKGGEYHDEIFFSMIKSDYEKRKNRGKKKTKAE